MNNLSDIGFIGVLISSLYLFVTLGLVYRRKLNKERELIGSSLRMTIQLYITGFILGFIFENPSAPLTFLIFFIMEFFALRTILSRLPKGLSKEFKKSIVIALTLGTSLTIFYFILVVVRVSPWYHPQYFIPITGMLVGNGMNAVAISANRLLDAMETERNLVEEALILGAQPKNAIKPIVDKVFELSIMPTINNMASTGIVTLPGMMTGQILAGASPITAIQYQIAIMLGILGSVAISTILFLELSTKSFFNDEAQLL